MTTPEAMSITAAGEREIVITRRFNAARRMVFDAHTHPELVRLWLLGPSGWTMPVCAIDFRLGGSYRYGWRHETDGRELGMGGVFREIVALERIVTTEKFDEPWYGPGEAVNTLRLTDQGGQTLLTLTTRYPSRAVRDTVLESGMGKGVEVSYDRLADLLASQGA